MPTLGDLARQYEAQREQEESIRRREDAISTIPPYPTGARTPPKNYFCATDFRTGKPKKVGYTG